MKHLASLFLITSMITACSNEHNLKQNAEPETKIITSKDSLHLKCIGDKDFLEKVDMIILDKGILTLKLGKYMNCAYSILDTFYVTNDTLNIDLTSADNQFLACTCYFEMYARFNYTYNKPKVITINGNQIGSGHGISVAEEK